MARNLRAVDESAVTAAAVLNDVFPAIHQDAGVRARGSGVADDEVAVRLPADAKGNWIDAHALTLAVGIHHHERCGPNGGRGGGHGFHLTAPRTRPRGGR